MDVVAKIKTPATAENQTPVVQPVTVIIELSQLINIGKISLLNYAISDVVCCVTSTSLYVILVNVIFVPFWSGSEALQVRKKHYCIRAHMF
jgi:hypothetical protein